MLNPNFFIFNPQVTDSLRELRINKATSSCTGELMSCKLSGPRTYKHVVKSAVLWMNQIKYCYFFTFKTPNCSCILLDPAQSLIILFDIVIPHLLYWPFINWSSIYHLSTYHILFPVLAICNRLKFFPSSLFFFITDGIQMSHFYF